MLTDIFNLSHQMKKAAIPDSGIAAGEI